MHADLLTHRGDRAWRSLQARPPWPPTRPQAWSAHQHGRRGNGRSGGDRLLRPSSRRLPTSLTRRSIRGWEPMIFSPEAPSSAANAVQPMSSIKLPLPCVRPVRLRPLARLRALASS
jgi:hypothetical protein